MKGRRVPLVGTVALAATFAVAATACSEDSANSAGDDSRSGSSLSATTIPTAGSTAPAYEPVYSVVDCEDGRFADLEVVPGAECGTLTVPENRADPTGRQVTLAVLKLPAADGSTGNTPLVYLSGGPGDSAIDDGWEQRTLAADRPVILVDQRGTGRSSPSLDCPEIDESTWRELAEGMDLDERVASTADAMASCRERLADEVDLDQYDTPAMAADMADLRKAMALDEWSIFGVSYGTAIGQEILRSHPEGLQAAVLDSVVPPDVDDGPVGNTRRAEEALRRVIDACVADTACAAAHPDLEEKLLTVRDRLNESPFEVRFTDSDGVERVARLTGDTVLSGAFQAMYDSSLLGLIPSLADQLATGQYGVLGAIGGPLLANITDGANGVWLSVVCADHQRLETDGDTTELREEHPLAAFNADERGCEDWDVESVPEDVNTISEVGVPTLLLAGEFDPVTPAYGTKRVAEEMGSKATFVEFPALGHGALFVQDQCPVVIADAFLRAPDQPVDTFCVAAMPGISFA